MSGATHRSHYPAITFVAFALGLTVAMAADDEEGPDIKAICGAIENVCVALCNGKSPTNEALCFEDCRVEYDRCTGARANFEQGQSVPALKGLSAAPTTAAPLLERGGRKGTKMAPSPYGSGKGGTLLLSP